MHEELSKLKELLPRGYARTLAEEFKCTESTVHNTLNGKTNRFDIIKRAVEMAKESKQVIYEVSEIVKNIQA